MPILVNQESYNGLNSLYANAGDWVDCEFSFSTQYQRGSGVSNKFLYTTTGTQHYITADTGNFGDYGFLAGDVVDITWTGIASGTTVTYSRNVLFVNGNNIFIDTPLPSGVDNKYFPTDGVLSGMSIIANKKPASIEAYINLAPNGTPSPNSVLDGGINRFEIQDMSSMNIGDTLSLGQVGDQSGGLIENVELTYVADANDGWKDWSITYRIWQWGVLQDGYNEPNYYENADCLVPFVQMRAFAQFGNPNGILTGQSENLEANTGGFDENYNGGTNHYPFIDIQWTDMLGNPIDAMDYSAPSKFVATIDAPFQNIVASRYRIGMVFRPVDETIYKNLPTNAGENLLLNTPNQDFANSAFQNPMTFQGYENSDGARVDLTALQFQMGSGTLFVYGKTVPNAAYSAYFSNLPDGERRTTMWVTISNHVYTGQFSDSVNVKIFDADNIDAPIKGVQIPDVISEELLDHAGNIITNSLKPQTTTEDDLIYKSDFLLVDNVEYEGIRTRIYAYNTVNEDEFTLENNFFSFDGLVNINGQYQPNFFIDRGFNLPPSTDRNHVSLVRNSSLDVSGKYGVSLEYSFLNDWRYWLAQSNVDNDFYDITEPNDGKNKNWQRYSNSGDWIIRVAYYTSVLGVEDFNNYELGIRPYEDDLDVTTVNSYEVLSTGQSATNLLADELMLFTSELTWANNYVNPWAEVTIEDKEAGNRWVISSVLDQGGISSNPLKPISGQTKLDLQYTGNVATLQCIIDTNIIDASDVCISSRIYSDLNPEGKRKTDGTLKQTTTLITKQKA